MTLRLVRGTLLCLALAITLAPSVSSAIQTDAKLTLGEPSAPPGSRVTVPLTLSVPESVNVGSLEIRLTFPKAQLTFTKVEPSGLAVGLDARVEATVENGPDAKSSTLRVRVATPGSAGERKPLPAGLLAYIGFTIAKTAKPDTTISLVHVATGLTTHSDPRPVTPLGIANGKINVTKPPVPACFFYMH